MFFRERDLVLFTFSFPVVMLVLFGSIFGDSFGLVNAGLRAIGLDGVPWLSTPWAIQVTIAVLITYQWTGYNAIIFLAGMQAIGTEVYEAAKLDGAVQTLLKAKPAEQAIFPKLMLLTSGPRLENLTFSVNREVEAELAEKERYRVYLIAYAGALLVLLAYFGGNLKAANLDLERRVQLRTRAGSFSGNCKY